MTIESNGEIIARQPGASDNGGNHFEGCWNKDGHHDCAVAEIERLKELVIELGGNSVALGTEQDT